MIFLKEKEDLEKFNFFYRNLIMFLIFLLSTILFYFYIYRYLSIFLNLVKNLLILFFILFHINSYCSNYYHLDNIFLYFNYNINNNNYYDNIIKDYFNKYVHKNYVDELLKYLYNTKKFLNIKYKFLNRNNLIIYLNYKSVINKILFYGNNYYSNSNLLFNLKKFNIKIGSYINNNNILYFKKYIIKKYKNIGKFNIKINIFFLNLYENKYFLKIKINEGNFFIIKNINLYKNNFIKKNKIFSLFSIIKGNIFLCKILNCIYSVNNLFIDLYNVKNFYFYYGYFDFFISKIKIYNFYKNKLNIYIEFYEGKRYKISDIILSIDKIDIYKKFLNKKKYFYYKNNIFYNFSLINNFIKYIKNFINNKGYANFYLNIFTKKLNNKIKFFLDIKLNNLFYVDKIIFKGSKSFNNNFLINKIPFIKGCIYNKKLINLGKNNLYNTNYFSFIEWKIKFHNIINSNKLDIIYNLIEKDTNLLNFKFGYGKKSYLNYEINFLKKKIFNLNNNFYLKWLKNSYFKYNNIYYLYPINIYNNIFIKNNFVYNNFFNNKKDIHGYLNLSLSFENDFIFFINKYLKYNFGLSYIKNYLYNIKPHLSILNYLNSVKKKFNFFSNKNNLISDDIFIRTNLVINKLDNFIFPKFGWYMDLDYRFTILNSSNFYKIYISLSKYIQLKKNFILFLHSNFGYLNSFFSKELPFYENFYFGENNLLRCFNLNKIGPRHVIFNSIYLKCNNNNKICLSDNISGGNSIFLFNAELILPNNLFIFGNYKKFFRTSFFLDSGVLWYSNWKNNFINKKNSIQDYGDIYNLFKLSFGLSFKFLTSFGTINLSYGFPILYHKNDEINNFQFNVGNFM